MRPNAFPHGRARGDDTRRATAPWFGSARTTRRWSALRGPSGCCRCVGHARASVGHTNASVKHTRLSVGLTCASFRHTRVSVGHTHASVRHAHPRWSVLRGPSGCCRCEGSYQYWFHHLAADDLPITQIRYRTHREIIAVWNHNLKNEG